MYNPFDFRGKKFVITGGTSGIGKATALMLAEQGASLFLLGRNKEKLIAILNNLVGSGHDYYVVDFEEKNDLKHSFDKAVLDGTKINGIIHCAAMADVEPLAAISEEKLFRSMRINLMTYIEMIKLFAKKKYHYLEGGSVVGVSSTSTLYPEKGNAIYVATKASMNVMIASFAKELVSKGIRINNILPASVDTPMLRKSDAESNIVNACGNTMLHNRQLLGVSKPEDIARVILFLLSDASSVITGRNIFADGGDIDFND